MTMAEDVACHAAWVIALCEMNRPGFEQSDLCEVIGKFKDTISDAGNRSSARGCTKKRAFLLEMTRDTIARATDRIKNAGSREVSSKRVKRKAPATPPRGLGDVKKGRPTEHKFVSKYKPDSNHCQICCAGIARLHKAAGRKVSQADIKMGAHGLPNPNWCRSDCPA